MTSTGRVVMTVAIVSVIAGVLLVWPSLLLLGLLFCIAIAYGFVATRSSQALEIERSLHPKKVTKGASSISMLVMRNKAVSSTGRIQVVQTLGERDLTAVLPPLLPKQSAVKSIPLPTAQRGHFTVGPITIRRSDIFGFFRREQSFGTNEELWVQPTVAPLRPLSTGFQRDIESATSDRAPTGNIAFHRLREYVPGDDPRLIDWKATARLSTSVLELMVRHNVDTTQPASVVVLDNDIERFRSSDFEEAVDVAASTTRAAFLAGGDLQLMTTSGDRINCLRGASRSDTPIMDFLTDVQLEESCSLSETLHELALASGGTTLIIVTGAATSLDISQAASLVKKFSRVLLISVSAFKTTNAFPQLLMLQSENLAGIVQQWNTELVS